MVCEGFPTTLKCNKVEVLILVLMEYGLREGWERSTEVHKSKVLILVLMEYGLRGWSFEAIFWMRNRLNPCFNGIWSARVKSVKICM